MEKTQWEKTTTKKQDKREAILKRQGGTCPICWYGQSHPDIERTDVAQLHTDQMCYVPEQDALVCRACSTYLKFYKSRLKVGVDIAALELFLSRGGER